MDEVESLRDELKHYESEKDKIRDVVGQIGGRGNQKWHNLLNLIFLAAVVLGFMFDLARHVLEWEVKFLPPMLLLEVAVLLVSLKIIWMIHMQSKVDHFQFWILNSIEFRVNMIGRRLTNLETMLSRVDRLVDSPGGNGGGDPAEHAERSVTISTHSKGVAEADGGPRRAE